MTSSGSIDTDSTADRSRHRDREQHDQGDRGNHHRERARPPGTRRVGRRVALGGRREDRRLRADARPRRARHASECRGAVPPHGTVLHCIRATRSWGERGRVGGELPRCRQLTVPAMRRLDRLARRHVVRGTRHGVAGRSVSLARRQPRLAGERPALIAEPTAMHRGGRARAASGRGLRPAATIRSVPPVRAPPLLWRPSAPPRTSAVPRLYPPAGPSAR